MKERVDVLRTTTSYIIEMIQALKKIPRIVKIYGILCELFFSILTILSPKLNTMMRYRIIYKRFPNLDNPKTFHEKLLWLKLYKYIHDPLVIKCTDKYLVREYIIDCGCGDILNDLYGVWDLENDIEWDELPKEFVLKWNFGAGLNIVCNDKAKLDYKKTISKLRKWKKEKVWLSHSEMHYKEITPKIICEKYLKEPGNDVVTDYKVYCFNGEPEAILLIKNRTSDIMAGFFDKNWDKLEGNVKYNGLDDEVAKPKCLEALLEKARILSHPFPFVRCDFYIIEDNIYFGELTFTPAAGIYTATVDIHGKSMADLINID